MTDSPGASTCPAQDPMSAPAPVMLEQGQSPDHRSPGPVAHPIPISWDGTQCWGCPHCQPLVAPGQSDGVALDGETLPGHPKGALAIAVLWRAQSNPTKHRATWMVYPLCTKW